MQDFKPLSGREFPRFSAIKTFFRLPHVPMTEAFDVGIVGIPFDGGVSYRPGGRFAPSQVREFSSLGRGFHWNRGLSLFEKLRIADVGDIPTNPISLAETHKSIETYVAAALKTGKRLVSVGGDHSITLPILRAQRAHWGRPLGFVHFDAHLDTYPAAWGQEYHHGSFLRHAVEEGLVDPKHVVQFGIRGPLAGSGDLEFPESKGFQIFTVDDIRSGHLNDVLAKLPMWKGIPTYISYDVDCLDPAYAPGTGTPVPGGLTTYETQRILRALSMKPVVGGDVVEICPPYDHAGLTSLAGVDALFEILCSMVE